MKCNHCNDGKELIIVNVKTYNVDRKDYLYTLICQDCDKFVHINYYEVDI